MRERFGRLRRPQLAYVGDGNNVARSLLMLGALAGVDVSRRPPPELALPGARVDVPLDEAVARRPRAYTDVWVSMGDEDDAERSASLLAPYRLDEQLLAQARDDAIVLHCLPAHPGEEISEGLLYGERSAVWDQAENRLHAQKALLELLVPEYENAMTILLHSDNHRHATRRGGSTMHRWLALLLAAGARRRGRRLRRRARRAAARSDRRATGRRAAEEATPARAAAKR